MNSPRWLALLLPALALGCSSRDEGTISFKELEAGFAEPSADYRPAPLWVWNGEETREEISASISEMKEAGFGGVFIHPRPGLVTEYLSDEWMSLYRYSIDECVKAGMNVWIYDENSYPSGFAGGYVPEQMPRSYNQGQGLVMETAGNLPADLKDIFIVLRREGDTYRDVTAEAASLSGKDGDYRIFRKTYNPATSWNAGLPYVDLMVEGVTGKFIELTMDAYERELGPGMEHIKGVFSDEPQIDSPGGVRWTPDLFSSFERKWGYRLQEHLPCLFAEEGDWRKVRHDYQSVLLDLFTDRWARPMYSWCEERGKVWTGHYWEHNWPAIGSGPDNMAMYAWHQMPGVDMLFNQFNEGHPQAQFGNVRAIKELRSVANQTGRERTLSETYGGAGWDVTFEDMKRLGDWEYVLGVNFMNQHLVKMHLGGSRKYDYPPVFSKPNPWWHWYRTQNDYFARLSWALSKGVQRNSILVLEPTTSLWCSFSVIGSSQDLWGIAGGFQEFVTRLEKDQVEYDLGCERIMQDIARADGSRLDVGECSYTTVVIPPEMTNLESSTFSLLKEFARGGGRIIALSSPYMLDGREDASLKEFFAGSGVIRCQGYSDLGDYLDDAARMEFSDAEGAAPYHHRREYADGQLLFLVNSSMSEESSFSVETDGRGVTEMDAFTGESFSYPFESKGDKVKFDVSLPPAGSLLLYVHDGNAPAYPQRDTRECPDEIAPEGEMSVTADSLNALYVDFCDLEVNGKKYESIHFADAAFKYYNEAGYNGNPWAEAIQFRSAYVRQNENPRKGDVRVTYHIGMDSAPDLSAPMRLVVERPDLWTVRLNGKEISPVPGEWWFDRAFGVFDLTGLLRSGDNKVTLETGTMSVFAEIEPVYLLGEFSLRPSSRGWTAVPGTTVLRKGSWKDQGYPFYSWGVVYSRDFQVSAPGDRRFSVNLRDWKGTVAQVSVNGADAGVIAYPPYSLDVTDLVKEGENEISVRVTGSLRNLQGPHHNNPPAGIGGPWEWKNIFGPVPAGEKYSLFDYGLYGDISLTASARE